MVQVIQKSLTRANFFPKTPSPSILIHCSITDIISIPCSRNNVQFCFSKPISKQERHMKADDELCLCFHVSWRKVIRFVTSRKIQKVSQVSECFGAGTGCGWCRRQISRLVTDIETSPPTAGEDLDGWLANRSPSAQNHAQGRKAYLEEKEGK